MTDGTDTYAGPWTYRTDTPSHYWFQLNTSDALEVFWLRPIKHETIAVHRIVDSLNRGPDGTPPVRICPWNARTVGGHVWSWDFVNGPTNIAGLSLHIRTGLNLPVGKIIDRFLFALNHGNGGLPPVELAED